MPLNVNVERGKDNPSPRFFVLIRTCGQSDKMFERPVRKAQQSIRISSPCRGRMTAQWHQQPRRGFHVLSKGFSPQRPGVPLRATAIMVLEDVFRYPLVCPAAKAAGYGCQARLRGLHRAIPDSFLENHY